MEERNYSQPIFYVLLLMVAIIIAGLCKILSSVVLPVVIAILLSFVFIPILLKITKKLKIPWVLTVIFFDIFLLFSFFGLSSLLFKSLSTITAEYPKYETKFMSIYKIIANTFNLEFDAEKSFISNIWGVFKFREYVQKIAVFLSSGIVNFAKSLFIVILLFTFLLIEIRRVKGKINAAFKGKTKGKVFKILPQIVSETVRFISIKFFISLATGVLVFLGTSLIKMDFPVVWGFLAFIMNFIPTFGSIISTILTTLFALLQFYPSWGKIAYVFVLLLSVNMILGNVVEPRVEGKHLGLSPFIILVSLSIWGWIWGFVGMILAVPMTVIIKIICENVSFLQGIAILMGNTANRPDLTEDAVESE